MDEMLRVTRDEMLREDIRRERRETFGTGRVRTRWKRCYELAGRAIDAAPRGTVYVEADWRDDLTIRHAWLVLPDGQAWDPVTCRLWAVVDWREAVVERLRLDRLGHAEAVLDRGFWGPLA